jgi:protein SCO1/2
MSIQAPVRVGIAADVFPTSRAAAAASVLRWLARLVFAFVLTHPAGASAVAATLTPTERYEQRLGEKLPLAVELTDESGKAFRLGEAFDRRPVVLIFGYWHCAQLCSVVSTAAIDSLRQLRPEPENDFEFLYVSIDASDTPLDAARARERDLRHFAHAGNSAHWHYLTGSPAAVRTLAQAAGFNYRRDDATRQYAHPSGFLVLTPGGEISQYFLGLDFRPAEVAKALHRASEDKVGRSTFDLVLLCFRGEGISGRYGRVVWHVLQFSVGATVLTLALGLGKLFRDERRRPGA